MNLAEFTQRQQVLFGRNLKRLLKERQLTVREFCELAGIDHPRCYRWLNLRCNISLISVAKIAWVLKVPVAELFREDETHQEAEPESPQDTTTDAQDQTRRHSAFVRRRRWW